MNEVESLALEGELEVSGVRGYSAYEIAVQQGFVGTVDEWLASLQGEQGPEGPQGEPGTPATVPTMRIGTIETLDDDEDAYAEIIGTPSVFILNEGIPRGHTGNGIASFEKTSTSGLVDTYTITFTDGTSVLLDISNGKSITGISKTSTSGLNDIYTITFNDLSSTTFTVKNGRGIISIDKTAINNNVDTYTITYNDNTTSTFDVTNGEVTQAQLDAVIDELERYEAALNVFPKIQAEGTDITLNNTIGGVPLNITPEGATTLVGTPSPDNAATIKVVTGNQNIQIDGVDYPLTLSTMELCRIGDYKDYIYGNPSGWYKHEAISNKEITSSLTYASVSVGTNFTRVQISKGSIGLPKVNKSGMSLCTCFKEANYNVATVGCYNTNNNQYNANFYLPTTVTTVAEAKTYMSGLTDNYIYFLKATEEDIQITDNTLIGELNDLYNVKASQGTTILLSSSGSTDNEVVVINVNTFKDVTSI